MFGRKPKVILISLVFIFTVIIFLVNQRDKNYPGFKCPDLGSDVDIDTILEETRYTISVELRNYNFSASGAQSLVDLVPENGGRPLKSLVIASWRTGSTFLGDILNSLPGTFYHYELLWHLRITQIKGPPQAENAIDIVKSAFRCEYTDKSFQDFFKYKTEHPMHFTHNPRMWKYCKKDIKLCLDLSFTEKFCKLFPFQTMKLVNLRLQPVDEVLKDKELNVKVILLIRDPRAMLQSRRGDSFCRPYPDCSRPEYFCADMLSDYATAATLRRRYPGRIKIIRYEDLVLDPYNMTRDLMKFLNLNYVAETEEFLNSHTNTINTEKRSTVRVSKDIAFKWKRLLNFDEVNEVQISCSGAMKKWGYLPAYNSTQLASKEFYPLGNYSVH